MNEPRYYTRKEAAAVLRVSVRTIDSRISDGQLRTVRFGRRRLIEHAVLSNIADSATRERLGV